MDRMLEILGPHLLRTEPDNKPVVVMICGIVGAGKTTLSKAILARYPSYRSLSIEEGCGRCGGTMLLSILRSGQKDLVMDLSFHSKKDREDTKKTIKYNGGRWVLVYLRVKSKEFVWDRIQKRRREGINAYYEHEMTREMLDKCWDGFEWPVDEGEIVLEVE
ncbi:P-loop containing nucleoside triphosphate hydrolase protein [Annulohypoxylon moriforme]|nr:P-loop containing nucleoside triphosphate hydrolase protein [Annulohypoxylon moriforme]